MSEHLFLTSVMVTTVGMGAPHKRVPQSLLANLALTSSVWPIGGIEVCPHLQLLPEFNP